MMISTCRDVRTKCEQGKLFFKIFFALVFGADEAGVDGFLGEEDWGFAGFPFPDGAG